MKKFFIKLSYTVIPVWILLVGMAVYLWVSNDNSGDLMRLGLIDGDSSYTDSIREIDALPKVYYKNQDNDSLLRIDSCDVVVIGDSFSHGGGVGKQGDYVNHLAHETGQRVVVFAPNNIVGSPIQVAYDVLKLGVIDSSNSKNLIVEEVERYLISRHRSFADDHTSLPRPKKQEELVQETKKENKRKDFSPLLRVKDYLFYHLFGANPIYKVQLSRQLFTSNEPDILYFYSDDVKSDYDAFFDNRQSVVDSYKAVIDLAKERGVNLVILIACDKYDMYQDFILDNPYPAKTLNEDIAKWMAPELDRFVIAKQVLHPLLEQGVKDVYLFNDTHWSPASSRLIAAEVAKKLK